MIITGQLVFDCKRKRNENMCG